MHVLSGLLSGMVLQRNSRGVSDASFNGTTTGAGNLEVRVTKGGKTLAGYSWVAVGSAKGGKFSGVLKGLKVGGPYDVQLRIAKDGNILDQAEVKDILVGDVWILGGQSNMQGYGRMPGIKPHNLVRAFCMDDVWRIAKDPIHDLTISVDASLRQGTRNSFTGVGPGVAFGQDMLKRTGVPQGLLACALGGSRMDQWDPRLKRLGGKSLYGAAIRKVVKNGGAVAGIVWYQGCSDANAVDAPLYTKRMKAMVSAFRRDCGNRSLPLALVQIGVVHTPSGDRDSVAWNDVQDQQRRLNKAIANCTCVPAIDLEVDDTIHISGTDQQRLGRRLAEAMCALTKRDAKARPPIEFAGFRLLQDKHTKLAIVEVSFKNVAGSLRCGSQPHGFALSDGIGGKIDALFRTTLSGSKVLLKTALPLTDIKGCCLHYGMGANCYVNITDEADHALPVFGPIQMGRPVLRTPFVQELRATRLLPFSGSMDKLKQPDLNDNTLGWARHKFPTIFCQFRKEIADSAPQDMIIHYACRLECKQDMVTTIEFGYDGPVKAWLDGKPLHYDPKGTNPALTDDAVLTKSLSAGMHEITVSLGTNKGKAWGIFLRFANKKYRVSHPSKMNTDKLLPVILG
jgi:hypothetical protein